MNLLTQMEAELRRLWAAYISMGAAKQKEGLRREYWALYHSYKKQKEYLAVISGECHAQK